MKSPHLAAAIAGLFIVLVAAGGAQDKTEAHNMALVGHAELQDRVSYQPSVIKQGDRWIAYVGHHGGVKLNPLTGKMEQNGTSIVDVTDPKRPKYLAHIPGGEQDGARMARVCNGSDLPHADKTKTYLLREFATTAHEVWDVTDPSKPSRINVLVSGLRDTHKNFWECETGIAYLVSGDPKWPITRMVKIFDLSDPTKPVFIRDFGLPEHAPGLTAGESSEGGAGHDHAFTPPEGWTGRFQDDHGPISTGPKGNRVYFPWGYNYYGILTIVDRDKLLNGPKEPTPANLAYPQVGRLDFPPDTGAHTAFPLIGMHLPEFEKQGAQVFDKQKKTQADRDFVVVMGEQTGNKCGGFRQMVHFIDVTFESKPLGVSTWTVPEASGNYCGRGERFGTHSTNENFTPIYYKRVLFVAHFAAGIRALDVRDPYNPKEIGYYNPAATDNINNVDVDDRGYVYAADRDETGLYILELTGEARKVANFPSN